MTHNHPFSEEDLELYIRGKSHQVLTEKIEVYAKENPKFGTELEAELLIRQGITAGRISEIKSTLSAIPVSLTPWYAATSTLLSASAIILTGTALYVGMSISENPEKNEETASDSIVTIDSFEKNTLSEPIEATETDEMAFEREEYNQQKVSKKSEEKTIAPVFEDKENTKMNTRPSSPEVRNEEFEIGSYGNADAPENHLSLENTTESSKVNVSRSSHVTFKNHYSYGNEVLTLYLDNDSEPYKILELKNTVGEKNLYLEYKGKFYQLLPTEGNVAELKLLKSTVTLRQLQDLNNQ